MDDRIEQLVKWMNEQKEKASSEKEREGSRNNKHTECYWSGAENAFSDAITEISEIFKV